MRIALVLNTAWNIYNFRLGLVQNLLEEGYEVFTIAPEDEFVPEITTTGAQFIPLRQLSRKGTNPIQDLKLAFELKSIFIQYKIDLALLYTIKPNIYGSLAAKWAGIPCICTVTGLGYSFLSKGLVHKVVKGLYKYAFRHSARVAFQNRDDLKLFEDLNLVSPPKTLLIKGSGIKTDYFHPLPKTEEKEDFIFLFVGRLLYDKGVRELLQAARKIKKDFQKVQIWLVGAIDQDNPSAISREELRNYEEDQSVVYLGKSNDVRSIMRNADAVLLPSYREGLPRVMLEGLAMGKPLITTDTAGCRETVIPGKNGLLVPVKDVQALEGAMRHFLETSKEELRNMGQQGRALVLREFDEKIIVQNYLSLIKELRKK